MHKITIYKIDLGISLKDFVFLAKNLPVVGPTYRWNNFDKAFTEYGNYVSGQQKTRFAADSLGAYSSAEINSALVSTNLGGSGIVRGSSLSSKFSLTQNNSLVKGSGPGPTPTAAYQVKRGLVNQVSAADGVDLSTPGESSSATPGVSRGFDIYYPFRSLFTGRQQNELEFGVEDEIDYFSFKAKIPKELVGYRLVIPQLEEKEVAEIDQNDLSKKTFKYPQIYIDGEFISVSSTIGGVMASQVQPATSEVSLTLSYIREGNLEIRVPKIKGYYSYNYQPTTTNKQPKSCDQFNKGIYKHEFTTDPTIGEDLLRLTSVGSSNCLDFDLPNLSQDIGYLVIVENRNIEGKSLLFSVINKNSQRADIETYLPKLSSVLSTPGESSSATPGVSLDRGVLTAYFIIPPMEQYGLGYTLHLDNISIGRVKTVNDLGRITVNPIPYRFLTGLKIIKGDTLRTQGVTLQNLRVDHPNPSLYQVIIDSSNMTLVLSQSFDDGWKAYSVRTGNNESGSKKFLINLFPFWFGNEIKDHVLVNNWENGWQIPQSKINPSTSLGAGNQQSTIIIVYLPQYLEYFGFILLGVGILIVILYPEQRFVIARNEMTKQSL